MALDPLATTADLRHRGIDASSTAKTAALAAASEAVREAAGSAISRVTSTISVDPPLEGQWLHLPGSPVVSVTTVLIGTTDVTADVRLRSGRIYRRFGWRRGVYPYDDITVTYVHGLVTVPADIVDLVCALAAGVIAAAADGSYESRAGVVMMREQVGGILDEVRYGTGADGAPTTRVEIPDRTRKALAARFGGGTYVTGTERP